MITSISRKHAKKNQLYFLLKELSAEVNNQDDFGILTGFTVLDSLASFKSKSSKRIKQLEEARRVYEGLDNTIVELMNSNGNVDNIFYNLKQRLSPVMDQDLAELKKGIILPQDSSIYQGFLETQNNSQGHYADNLRKKGIELQRRVKDRGYLRGDKSVCQKADFNDLYLTFVGR